MSEGWYEGAVLCTNGHVVNAEATSYPEIDASYCELCGAPTLRVCPLCGAAIRGMYHIAGTLSLTPYAPPLHCPGCGEAYPWTEARIAAAHAVVDALAGLSQRERGLLKTSIVDLTADGPAEAYAVILFKRLVTKAGSQAAATLQEVLVSVLSEAARRAIWG